MYLIAISRPFHPKAIECTFVPSAHGILFRIDPMLGHKANLSKFMKTEIISSNFYNHNTLKLEINYDILKNSKTQTEGG